MHTLPAGKSVAVALGSRFGSGGSVVTKAATGWGAVPAAHGLGLIVLSPADRYDVAAAPQAGAVWPLSSKPSAQIALDEPLFEPATQVPGAVQTWLSVYTLTLPRSE